MIISAANFLLLFIETAIANELQIYTKHVKKLEELYEEARYIIRYEKGNFNSGYCILEERRVVVINKFFSVEGRINALIEILPSISVNEEELSGEMLKWYKQLKAEPSFGTDSSVQTQMDI